MLTDLEVYGMLAASPAKLSLPIIDVLGVNPLQIRGIDGIGPVAANILTSPTGALDGELYTGSSQGKRNVVIKMGLNPDWADQTIESLRAELYKYFMPQLGVYLRFISTHLPTCEVAGYVESMDPNIFSKDPEINISIICPKPDLISIDETVVTGIVGPGEIPVDINYLGHKPTGFVLRVTPGDTNPAYTGLYTIETLIEETVTQKFSVTGTVDADTTLIMSSVPGDKFVHELSTDGTVVSRLSDAVEPYNWMQLFPGSQQFHVSTIETGLEWSLSYFDRFGGL